MFIERTCEVAFKKFVVIDGLGNDSTNKLEVTQMIGVAMWWRIDGISDSVSWWCKEKCIVGIEDFARYDEIPLPQ